MKYKVRITKSPNTEAQEMAYGGQSGYGLDLGQKDLFDTMNKSPFESVSDTIQSVPREEANIEAEKGETILGDFDQDGMNEHMKIGGKRHSEGGTPLNVPEGSFVFSDTKKMKIGGDILTMFGKSATGKKYTPAKLAKQYDINKFKADLENPNVDALSKKTADMMIRNNEKKLGQLAFVQEGMKGFPNGIPDIALPYVPTSMQPQQEMMSEETIMAKFGGSMLPTYQTKGQTTEPRKLTKEEFEKIKASGKYKQIPGTNNWEYYNKVVKPATQDETKVIKGTPGKKYTPNENAWWRSLTPEQKAAHNAKVRQRLKTDPVYAGTPDRTEVIKGKPEEVIEERDVVTYADQPADNTTTTFSGMTPNKATPVTTGEGNYGRRPFFGTSMMVGPYRESFYAAPFNAAIPRPTFFDPNRELAANAEQANITQGYLSTFGAPQGFMANASGVQGKAAENAANIMSRTQNMNVGVANQFAPLQTDIMNKVMAYRADAADKLYFNNQQGNKAYRNSTRQWLNNMDKYRRNEYNTETMTTMMNQTNPYYDTVWGPRGGNMRFKPGVNVADLITGNAPAAASGASGGDMQKYLSTAAKYKQDGLDASVYLPLLKAQFPQFFTTARTSTRGNPIMPYTAGYLGMLGMQGVAGSGPMSAASYDDYDE